MEVSDLARQMVMDCNFLVTIKNVLFGFSKVTNISAEIEYEAMYEGGNNDSALLIRKPKEKADTLTLENGIHGGISNGALSLFTEGAQVEQVMILVIQNHIQIEKAFTFEKGMIIKREFSALDAQSGKVFLQTLQIAHTGLMEVAVPGA